MGYKYELIDRTVNNCNVYLDEDGTLDVEPINYDEYFSFMYKKIDLETNEEVIMSWSSTELVTLDGNNELESIDELRFFTKVNRYVYDEISDEELIEVIKLLFDDDE